jgi:hypothetical protein
MKVRCIEKSTPRSDGVPGQPTGLTIGKTYKVAEVLSGGRSNQYSIINDDFKIARYSQCRFEVVCDEPVKGLRDAFNWLTTELRSRIKELESNQY